MTTPHPDCDRRTGPSVEDEDAGWYPSPCACRGGDLRGYLAFNPLVRTSDQSTGIRVVVAVVVMLLAVPIAAAVGTGVYDSQPPIHRAGAN